MTEALPAIVAQLRQIGQACSDAAHDLRDETSRLADHGQSDGAPALDDGRLALIVERILKLRRERERVFGAALFADPVWDMLLDLFVQRLHERRVSVSSLCIAAAVPSTTALRYIALLEAEGLVMRSRAHDDCRKRYVELTADGYGKVRTWLRRAETLIPALAVA